MDLDIEYVNFDFPAEPYLHPQRTFALQEVVEATVEKQLLSFGIVPLHLLNGRGHHFIWRIRRDSKSFDQLRAIGHPTQSILSHYERTASPGSAKIDLVLSAAYHGLDQAIEYLAAEVKRLSAGSSAIPVELTAVEVGPGERGREMSNLRAILFGLRSDFAQSKHWNDDSLNRTAASSSWDASGATELKRLTIQRA